MKAIELLYGLTENELVEADAINPHFVPPGGIPSFAGPRPATPMPNSAVNPHYTAPGITPSFAGPRADATPPPPAPAVAPTQMASADQVNPHFVQPGSIPSFAGPRPATPTTPATGPQSSMAPQPPQTA